jgi:hypothetical protein
MSKFFSLDLSETKLVCICYVDRPSSAKVQYAVRRLLKKSAGSAVILAFLDDDESILSESVEGATQVSGTLASVIDAIVKIAATVYTEPDPVGRPQDIQSRA